MEVAASIAGRLTSDMDAARPKGGLQRAAKQAGLALITQPYEERVVARRKATRSRRWPPAKWR
jgi:hypothetical protein